MKLQLVILLVTIAVTSAAPKSIIQFEINREERIIGGQPAIPNSFPYVIRLFIRKTFGTFGCGASLISTSRVLTAGHCFYPNTSVIDVTGN